MYTLTFTTQKRAASRSWIPTEHGGTGSVQLRHRVHLVSRASSTSVPASTSTPASLTASASASAFNQQSKNPARLSAGRRNNIIKENHNGQKTEHRAIPLNHGKRKKTGHRQAHGVHREKKRFLHGTGVNALPPELRGRTPPAQPQRLRHARSV